MKKETFKRSLSLLCVCALTLLVGCAPSGGGGEATTTTTTENAAGQTTTTAAEATGDSTTATTADGVTTTSRLGPHTVTKTTTTGNATTTAPVTTTQKPTTKKTEAPEMRIITCYGDSVTEGMSVAKGSKYPDVLQQLLGSNYTVQNAGDGGEKTYGIMARQGAVKLYTANDLCFVSGNARVSLASGTGHGLVMKDGTAVQWHDPFGRDVRVSKVTINGAEYELEFNNFKWASPCTCDTFLKRSNTKKVLEIPAGSEVVLEVAQTSKSNYCDIYLMGFNGTWTGVDDLIGQYRQMVTYRGNDRYLVIIPNWNPGWTEQMTAAFKTAFGDHALDLIAWCANGGTEKAGVTLTTADKSAMRNDMLPWSAKLSGRENENDVHLSATGYKLLAYALHEQGQKLSLW